MRSPEDIGDESSATDRSRSAGLHRSSKLGLCLLGLLFLVGLALSYRASRSVDPAAQPSASVGPTEPREEPSEVGARPQVPSAELEVQVRVGQAPLPEASVVLAGPGTVRPDFRSATTGAAGNARFSALAAGDYGLRVTHPEFATERQNVPVAAGANRVRVSLVVGGLVFGRVLDAQDRPIAAAEISVLRAGTVERLRVETTLQDGSFQISGLPLGELSLAAQSAAYRPLHRSFRVQKNGERQELKLRLMLGRTVVGRVLTVEGTPVAGARVGSSDDSGRLATSDQNGHFELGGLGDGPVHLFATLAGFATVHRRDITPGTGPVELVLARGARVHGAISLPAAANEVTVSVCHHDSTFDRELCVARRVVRPPARTYELDELPAGDFQLVAEAPGLPAVRLPVRLVAGQALAGPELAWQR
jgi:hypothetical protein